MKAALLKKIEKLLGDLNEHRSQIESGRDEMQDKYDDRTDNWKDSEAGEKMAEELSYLDDIVSSLEQAEAACENIIGAQ